MEVGGPNIPGRKRRHQSRLPTFHSVEEEAEFWDTHSPLDFPEEFKEVAVKVHRPLQHLLGVRLDAATITKLGLMARAKGIGPSTLARIWIMERLAQEDAKEPAEHQSPDVRPDASKSRKAS